MKYRTQCCDQCHRRTELYYIRAIDGYLCEECIFSDETQAAKESFDYRQDEDYKWRSH
jgi:hypothetical protein